MNMCYKKTSSRFLYIVYFAFALAIIQFVCTKKQPKKLRIVVIGDSTVQTFKPERNITGWGQVINTFFTEDVEIINLAKSGRSTKTFIKESRWEDALKEKGNYIFIQFGHNDSHAKEKSESTDAETDYKDYLRQYVDETKENGAIPVLITPMHRRRFDEKGKVTQELLPYADAMKTVAKEKKVLCVALHKLSGEVFQRLGDEKSSDLSCRPGDRTHFSRKGAVLIAKLITEELFNIAPIFLAYR